MEASYYNKLKDDKVQCTLCPHNCIIRNGRYGNCRIRHNNDGRLETDATGVFASVIFDPIEKKPLYHYFPGKDILSIGGLGCNLRCEWCQNCEISQRGYNGFHEKTGYSANDLYEIARRRKNNIGIAFTYNEPTIAFETNIEIARLFRSRGLKNVLVTNGYLNTGPLQDYLDYIDALNIDIKSFNKGLHKKHTGAELEYVLRNVIEVYKSGAHLEITHLVVPGVSDNEGEFKELVRWIRENLSAKVPLHISRYFPRHKFFEGATPADKLEMFYSIAADELEYVYLGNLLSSEGANTSCAGCGKLLVSRTGYIIDVHNVSSEGRCNNCQEKVFVSE